METVNDVTDGLIIEGGDRGSVSNLIDSLNNLIITDALTSLYNRRFIDDFNLRLHELSEDHVRVNIGVLDLDNMKEVNDEFGHLAGDALLKDVAGFLKLHYGSKNEANERYAVRYGGDEFVIIDVGSDYEQFQRDVLARYEQMRRVCYFGDVAIPFSLSIGFASSDEFGWHWNVLLSMADQRMYEDKHKRERAGLRDPRVF